MKPRRRLTRDQRRRDLIDIGTQLFAAKAYDDVLMEDIAERAGVSRALLYGHFPCKRDLFGAVYEQAAAQLIAATELNDERPLAEQVSAGLDAHIDYFVANRNTVLAANRVLAGDPTIQAIISDELAVIRARLLDAIETDRPEAVSAALMSWLVFVRVLCVDWLVNEPTSRVELRDMCLGALYGALTPILVPRRLLSASERLASEERAALKAERPRDRQRLAMASSRDHHTDGNGPSAPCTHERGGLMGSTRPPETPPRPWTKAIVGSAAVAVAVAVVAWTASDVVEATIALIAIFTIGVVAVWNSHRRDPCR